MTEEWRPIVGYKNYKVSNLGNVMNKHGRILKPNLTKKGYLRMSLCNVEQKYFFVHRLVLQTFNPTDEELDCDHINHITTDNRLANLRWCSRSQNIRYRIKQEGLTSKYIGVSWYKRCNKWRTRCHINGKSVGIGYFDNEKDAGKAYNDFVIKHGLQDFNILNDI